MDLLNATYLRALAHDQCGPHVSIFLPTQRTWPKSKPDRVRLEHLLNQAGSELLAQGHKQREVEELLAPALALLDDEPFWDALADGLALFASKDRFERFRVPIALPELQYVGERFMLKPLLPIVSSDAAFLVLALAEEQDVRLLRCSRYTIERLALPRHPHTVDEATGFEEPQRGFAYHPAERIGAGKRHATVKHTVGVQPHDTKEELLEFAQQLDRALHPLFIKHNLPIVLAGAPHVTAAFRKATGAPNLLEKCIEGANKRLDDVELRDRAWEIVANFRLRPLQQAAADRFRKAFGLGSASADLHEIVPKALTGEVATLFVASDVDVWGRIEQDGHTVAIHESRQPGDDELLDAAACGGLRHKTEVTAVPRREMPDELCAAATFWF